MDFDEFRYRPEESPQKKARNDDDRVASFEEWFGKQPREVQVEVFDYVCEHTSKAHNFILEMPTGGGKSLVAAFAGMHARKFHGCKRIVYVTSSKSLQMQVARDALTWNLSPSYAPARVTCQFGRNNYFCPCRIDHLLSVPDEDDHSIFYAVQGLARKARFVKDYLQKMKNIPVHTFSCDHDFWNRPYREVFQTDMQKQLKPESIQQLWNEISVSSDSKSVCPQCNSKKRCKCSCWKDAFCKTAGCEGDRNIAMLQHLKCGYNRIKIMSKLATFVVINMDVLFSYVAHNGLDELQKLIAPTDFVVIDEAHMLAKRGSELFKDSQLRPFDIQEFASAVQEFPIIRGQVDPKLFRVFKFPKCALQSSEQIVKQLNGLESKISSEEASLVLERLQDVESKLLMVSTSLETATNDDSIKSELGELCNNLGIHDTLDALIASIPTARETRQSTNRIEEPFDDKPSTKLPAGLLISFQGTWWRTKIPMSSGDFASAIRTGELVPSTTDELEFVKTSLVDKIEQALLDAEKVHFDGNFYFNECMKRTSDDISVEKMVRNAKQGYHILKDLETVKSAVDGNRWKSDANLYMKNIPRISSTGVDYDLTFLQKASALGKVFKALPRGCLFTSATISCPEKIPEYKFEDFFTECGLSPNTPAMQTSEVFDSKKLTIFVPPMKKYKYSADDAYKSSYENERLTHLETTIQLNPKSTLVVGNNLVDIESVHCALKARLADHVHILYNSEQEAFDDFVRGTNHKVVVYGSERLFTGVDLPGKIGAIAILKPFNDVRIINDSYYRSIRQTYNKEFGDDVMDKFDQLYRYSTCRSTIQAAGRILRQHSDSGVVLFLSNNRTDALMLQDRYKNSPLVDSLEKWPY